MIKALLRLYARLPLPLIHGLGATIGWIVFAANKKMVRRIEDNLMQASFSINPISIDHITKKSMLEAGKSLAETLAIWFMPPQHVIHLVKACKGWEHVGAALANKKGIIFLTPHLGCYEITARYYASKHPMSVLFRPHRKRWLAPIVEAGRQCDNITLAPTNMKGVRTLLRTLKQGDAVGILPDQVPGEGEGEWSEFFGRPAYTMSLVGKLAESTGATVLMAFGERLSWGRGYIIHIEPFITSPTTLAINQAIENLVHQYPAQYLWSYNRHKQPKAQKTS